MEKYGMILTKLLYEKDRIVSEKKLNNYFEIISKIGIDNIIINDEKREQFIKEFEETYKFFKYQIGGEGIKEKELKELLDALKSKLDKKIDLLLLLPLIIYLDCNKILYKNLFYNCKYSKEIKEKVINLFKRFSTKVTAIKLPEYNWEVEVYSEYKNGLKNLDFEKIYKFIDVVRPVQINPFFDLSLYIILKNYFDDFLIILNETLDPYAIKMIIKRLEKMEKIAVGRKSDNFLVKFEVIRDFLYFKNIKLENNIKNELSKIILDFTETENVDIWEKFVKFYVLFPTRSPHFFIILGEIFSKINKKSLKILFENMVINTNAQKGEIEIIDSCFIKENIKDGELIKIIYEKWENIINDTNIQTSIILTSYIHVIINYVTNMIDEKVCAEKRDEYLYNIKEIKNHWFKTEREQTTFFYKNLSFLFVFGFGVEEEEKEKILSELKKMGRFLSQEQYLLVSEKWRNHLKKRP